MVVRSLVKRSDGHYSYIFSDNTEQGTFIVHETDTWRLYYDLPESGNTGEFFNRFTFNSNLFNGNDKSAFPNQHNGHYNEYPLVLVNVQTDDTIIIYNGKDINEKTVLGKERAADIDIRTYPLNDIKEIYKPSEIIRRFVPLNISKDWYIVYSTLSKNNLLYENIIEGNFTYEPYRNEYINNYQQPFKRFKFEIMHNGKTLNRIINNGEKNELFELPEGWKVENKPLRLHPAYELIYVSPNGSKICLPGGTCEGMYPEQLQLVAAFESLSYTKNDVVI